MEKGYIHSIVPDGFVDGPGLRMVVFLSGCKLRCLFCHNPDTWNMNGGTEMTTEEVLSLLKKNLPYYKNGGLTLSGGEPLLQEKFVIELFKEAKKLGVHTALDTSGVGNGNYEEILFYTDLVILDIKAYKKEEYLSITKHSMKDYQIFLNQCQQLKKPLWIRQVIIPGINDTKEYIMGLKNYFKNILYIEKIELLPYHLYGVSKYKELNLPYPLEGVPPMKEDKLEEFYRMLNEN